MQAIGGKKRGRGYGPGLLNTLLYYHCRNFLDTTEMDFVEDS